ALLELDGLRAHPCFLGMACQTLCTIKSTVRDNEFVHSEPACLRGSQRRHRARTEDQRGFTFKIDCTHGHHGLIKSERDHRRAGLINIGFRVPALTGVASRLCERMNTRPNCATLSS